MTSPHIDGWSPRTQFPGPARWRCSAFELLTTFDSRARMGALVSNLYAGPCPVSDEAFVAQAFTPTGVGLRPFSVTHVEQPRRKPRATSNLTVRRTRGFHALPADSWGGLEVPLAEELEALAATGAVEWRGQRVGSIKTAWHRVSAKARLEWVTPHTLKHGHHPGQRTGRLGQRCGGLRWQQRRDNRAGVLAP